VAPAAPAVVVEPPVLAVVLHQAHLPVLAPAQVVAVPRPLREPVAPLLAPLVVVVHRVVEPAVPLPLLLSRPSSSAATARITS
jgi:hypothetical protein